MGIRLIEPNASVSNMVTGRLAVYANTKGFRTRALAAAAPQSLATAAAHPVFQLGLQDVGQAAAMERATMSGWRYLLTSKGQVVAAAHARATGPRAKATFSHVNEGPQVRSTQQALAAAETWPEVSNGRYALGLLQVPSLYLEALWLRDDDGKDGGDYFVPLAPAPAPLVALKRYGTAEFEKVLAELKALRAKTRDASN